MMKEIVTPFPTPAAPDHGPREPRDSREIQRFLGAERLIHWALAIPFSLLYLSALLLLATGYEPQPRNFHHWIALVHRAGGVCLIALPPLALLLGIRQWRTHFENIREGWVWDMDDLRWLLLFPRAAVDSRIKLPEQGKFNAAEKLNFMMVSTTYPLYIATGIWIWMPGVAFLAWIAHFTMAVVGLPLVLGHIFMATANPGTRIGLQGMVTGWVDREWAKHHYRRWYRGRFERAEPITPPARAELLLQRTAMVRCPSCHEVSAFGNWEQLMRRVFQVEPLFCPKCHAEILVVAPEADVLVVNAILEHLESNRGHEPFHERDAISA